MDENNTESTQVTVSEPLKHGEGSNAFVSYLVTSTKQVRRRFQDFVTLHRWFCETHPQCIIPPLPGKHRMEYVTGDRFSEDFLEKRRLSLQCFIDRIRRHQILSNSDVFHKFLTVDQMAFVDTSVKKENGFVFDTIGNQMSEVLVNAFAKVKIPDDKFVQLRDQIDKFETNIANIEKLHSKLYKLQSDMGVEYEMFGGSIESLSAMETESKEDLLHFGTQVKQYAKNFKEKSLNENLTYVNGLHDYVSYCQAAKDTLKLRDQKQIDHEELNRFLASNTMDRDRAMATGKSPGISGFFKDKINDLKGVDPEKTRQDRLGKLNTKIEELQAAVTSSEDTSREFSIQVTHEIEFFNQIKLIDFKELFQNYTNTQVEFHQNVS
ncbi:hypothetical protein BC833DRAFT_527970 [Globomyces pollinis-pini]|nr:hypothetical protein BC833DRAFT_527970 [Globomyces pollinis-pini]